MATVHESLDEATPKTSNASAQNNHETDKTNDPDTFEGTMPFKDRREEKTRHNRYDE